MCIFLFQNVFFFLYQLHQIFVVLVLLTYNCVVFSALLQGEGWTAFEEMETLVFLFSLSALGILYAMNTNPELQE